MKDEPQSLASAHVVGTVQKLGPIHARGLDRLVGIISNIRQGEPFDSMSLDLDLSCGIAPLRIADQNFDLGLRACFVSLALENCEVQPNSRYEHWLEVGAFTAS